MIKSILFLSALLGVQTMPVHTDDQYVGQQERQYQHTEDIGGNTEVTYKYESNIVNSIDDLVVGNIYQIDTSLLDLSITTNLFRCTFFNSVNSSDTVTLEIDKYTSDYFDIYVVNSDHIEARVVKNGSGVNWFAFGLGVSYFVYYGNVSSSIVPFIEYTDYNEVLSVTYNPPTSLFGLMADFFDEYIYSGIPHINDINYEVNGTTITMKDWLVVSTTIAVVILFLFILFFIFRWLIRTFSNAFLWR